MTSNIAELHKRLQYTSCTYFANVQSSHRSSMGYVMRCWYQQHHVALFTARTHPDFILAVAGLHAVYTYTLLPQGQHRAQIAMFASTQGMSS